jgi:phosphopantetheinyl transferase
MNEALSSLILGEKELAVVLARVDIFPETPVSDEETSRANSMSSSAARRGFLSGRRLVRNLLSRWLSMDSMNLPIRLSPDGRPYLEGGSVPFFSISHSGDLVMVAFFEKDVGADVELVRPLDMVALSTRFFSDEEARLVREQDSYEMFFRLWTCREAAIKADGRGMAKLLGLTRVNARHQEGGFLNVEIGNDTWTVSHRVVDSAYHLAVATKNRPSLIRWCDLR